MGLFDEVEKTRRAKQNPQTAKLLALTRALDQARRRRDGVLAKAREAEDAFQAARSALRDFEAVLDAKSEAIVSPPPAPVEEPVGEDQTGAFAPASRPTSFVTRGGIDTTNIPDFTWNPNVDGPVPAGWIEDPETPGLFKHPKHNPNTEPTT